MDNARKEAYIAILQYELISAFGCTEPAAVAFAAARAAEILKKKPEGIELACSGSIIKNVHSVTIPNADGLKGVTAAAALGAAVGSAEKQLCILEDVAPEQIAGARQLLAGGACTCSLAKDVDELYIHVCLMGGGETAEVTIEGAHTNVVLAKRNGETLLQGESVCRSVPDKSELTLKGAFEFAKECEVARIAPLMQSQVEENAAIAQEGLRGDYGVNVGRSLLELYGRTDVRVRARAAAAAGSDARMSGCMLPVVINSGSGNQGMTVSLPVAEYAAELGADRETLYRALALANLTAILQKRSLGNLSAFCGAVNAAAGAACGIAYLMGGGYEDCANIVAYTLGTIGGMFCDGAKASCAAKISQALDTALTGLQISMKKRRSFQNGDGLIRENVEQTIESFGVVGRDGMRGANEKILEIMLTQGNIGDAVSGL